MARTERIGHLLTGREGNTTERVGCWIWSALRERGCLGARGFESTIGEVVRCVQVGDLRCSTAPLEPDVVFHFVS